MKQRLLGLTSELVKRTYSTSKRPKVAVVGSGPAGFYFTGSLRKLVPTAEVEIVEADPVPFGLVRYGVAPDHPEVKNCINQFESYVAKAGGAVRFFGNVRVGRDVSVAELCAHYDAVVFCYGAAKNKKLELGEEGATYDNLWSARSVVAWYNGHPKGAGRKGEKLSALVRSAERVAIVGLGNVALDIARILLSDPDQLAITDIRDKAHHALHRSYHKRIVSLVGRRGPLDAAFTIKEYRELLKLTGIQPPVVGTPEDFVGIDTELIANLPRPKRRLADLVLKSHQESPNQLPDSGRSWEMRFHRSPVGVLSSSGRVTGVELAVNRMEGGRIVDTGEREVLETDLLITSLGYLTVPIPGLPFDEDGSVVATEDDGYRVRDTDNCYACGWCAHGPNGVIATTQGHAKTCADIVSHDLGKKRHHRKSHERLETLLRRKGVRWTEWEDWEAVNVAEVAAGQPTGKPRHKITDTHRILQIASRQFGQEDP